MVAPHRLGDGALEERRDDEVGAIELDRLRRDRIVDVELDGYLMPAPRQLDIQALRQAVEAVGEEQDFCFMILRFYQYFAHKISIKGSCFPAGGKDLGM